MYIYYDKYTNNHVYRHFQILFIIIHFCLFNISLTLSSTVSLLACCAVGIPPFIMNYLEKKHVLKVRKCGEMYCNMCMICSSHHVLCTENAVDQCSSASVPRGTLVGHRCDHKYRPALL